MAPSRWERAPFAGSGGFGKVGEVDAIQDRDRRRLSLPPRQAGIIGHDRRTWIGFASSRIADRCELALDPAHDAVSSVSSAGGWFRR